MERRHDALGEVFRSAVLSCRETPRGCTKTTRLNSNYLTNYFFPFLPFSPALVLNARRVFACTAFVGFSSGSSSSDCSIIDLAQVYASCYER